MEVEAKKVNGTTLKTYEIVIMAFLVNNQGNKVRFLEKNFLIANVSLKIIFGISFLILSGIDVDFLE